MPSTAFYARYSTDEQRATSIEDQLRRCRQVAEKLSLAVDEDLIFSDAAVTGTASGMHKRAGYQRLMDAIKSGVCDTVITDEVSRLTRSPAEGGRLIELAESTGVRFITADGIDTEQDNWKLNWLFKLTTATSEVDAVSYRTKRGMLGQLQRGYQIAQAPYGYRAHKEMTDASRVLGTKWTIHEAEAAILRKMYDLKIKGYSGTMIAKVLNDAGIPPPGQHRVDGATYWRSATVLRILASPIYRGVFVWNGSAFARSKAKKRRKQIQQELFDRPQLRIVSDEVWWKANPRFADLHSRTIAPRGGGKRLFSGIVRCGDCGALCCPGTGNGKGSLYCPQCEAAVRAGGKDSWIGYSSVSAAQQALYWVLRQVFRPGPVIDAVYVSLEERLRKGPGDDIAKFKSEIAELEERITRIKTLMLSVNDGALHFAEEFNQAAAKKAARQALLKRAEEDNKVVDEAVVEAQRNLNLQALLHSLVDGDVVEPFKTKATLARLLSTFVLVARPDAGVSVFRIGLRPGVMLAEATSTTTLDEQEWVFELRVSAVRGRRPVQWSIVPIRAGRMVVTSSGLLWDESMFPPGTVWLY